MIDQNTVSRVLVYEKLWAPLNTEAFCFFNGIWNKLKVFKSLSSRHEFTIRCIWHKMAKLFSLKETQTQYCVLTYHSRSAKTPFRICVFATRELLRALSLFRIPLRYSTFPVEFYRKSKTLKALQSTNKMGYGVLAYHNRLKLVSQIIDQSFRKLSKTQKMRCDILI